MIDRAHQQTLEVCARKDYNLLAKICQLKLNLFQSKVPKKKQSGIKIRRNAQTEV